MDRQHSRRNGNSLSSDPVLSEHAENLASLERDFKRLVSLSRKSAQLEDERLNAQHFLEGIAETLLKTPASDPDLEEQLADWEAKLVSYRAQASVNDKLERTAEEALQKRLGADIAASERLLGFWVRHIEERESLVLLETVTLSESGKPEVQAAARRLARAGKVYAKMVAELGEAASVSYAWTRPLDPLPSEKSVAIQVLMAHDPLFAPPKRTETVGALLSAAQKQVDRWAKLLEQVSAAVVAKTFVMPSYLEPPKEQLAALAQWNQAIDDRSWLERYLASINRRFEDLTETEQQIVLRSAAGNESWKTEAPMLTEGVIVAEG